MKVILIGTVEFTEKVLRLLINNSAVSLVGVVTKKASSFNADYAALGPICEEYAIDVLYTADINSYEGITWITQKKPDVIFCFGWSSLIKKEVLNIPPQGVIGFHPAALPHNRGRHPIIWALVLGLKKTASTFFFMDEGADTGDILSQKPVDITFEDDARTLYDKITSTALQQLEDFIPALAMNNAPRTPQNKLLGNSWRKRGKKDGEIDFRMSSYSIYNLVRALTKPYVGAHVVIDSSEHKVWKVAIQDWDQMNIEPGKILDVKDNKLLIKTGDAAIWLLEHGIPELPLKNSYI